MVVVVNNPIYRTYNAGDEWHLELDNAPTLHGAFMMTAVKGYVVGHGGMILVMQQ